MMRLTIIGFGNQAKAWSQNLKDSSFPFRVALKPGSHSIKLAQDFGMEVVEIGTKEFYQDKIFALLTPDQTHEEFMAFHAPGFSDGTVIMYNHGFSLCKAEFDKKYPQIEHVLFAVKAIGSEIRRQYELKGKLGAVYSLEHFKGESTEYRQWLKTFSDALGMNMGIFKTSFEKETQADLYSEQGLLCSLIPYTAKEMFDHLVEAGVEPELAYFELWHELKLIVNAMVDKGPAGFYDLISPNALIGSEKGYERLITPDFKENLRGLFSDIQSGTFNQEIDKVNPEELRKKIRSRWDKSALMDTFNKINKESL